MLRLLLVVLIALPFRLSAGPAGLPVRNDPEGTPYGISNIHFRHGDDAQWAGADFDDSRWETGSLRNLPSRDGVYWLRFRVTTEPQVDAVTIAVVASYDLYWDGRLIGRSGRVGATPATEVPGPVDNVFRLPDELAGPGPHLVAMRLSSFHTGFPGSMYGLYLRFTQLRDLLLYRSRTTAAMMIGTGGAILVGVVFLVFWVVAVRRASVALFALACVGSGLERGLQAWRWIEPYPYDWHYPRLLAITYVVAALSLIRLAFLLSFFRVRYAAAWLGGLIVILIIGWQMTPLYNLKALILGCSTLVVSLAITLIAVVQRQRGSAFVLLGLLVTAAGLAMNPTDFLEQSFVYNSGAVMLGFVTALSLQLRDEYRVARQSQLTAARLEVELLKKHIQPHFLLNSLATIIEVIEEDPKTAVALIEALAGEFRILARVSGEKLIPLGQELALCHAHLRVMSLRKGARCTLAVAPEADERLLIPPALFHTLVENGLTHLMPRGGVQRFELATEREGSRVRFTFAVRGDPSRALDPADTVATVGEGTGLRYIKARLAESFTGRWKLECARVPDGWRTVIELEGVSLQMSPTEVVRESGSVVSLGAHKNEASA